MALVLANCVVWGNTGGDIEAARSTTADVSYCCIGGDTVWPGENNISEDPLFVDVGSFDFQGFTESRLPDFVVEPPDYRLQPASPAINAGNPMNAPGTDIEGNVRPCGAGVDMGAYEAGDCSAPGSFRRGDCNGDGQVLGQVTDAVFLLNYNFASGTEPPCLAACDADGDGRVTGQLTDAVYLLNFNFLGGPAPVPARLLVRSYRPILRRRGRVL